MIRLDPDNYLLDIRYMRNRMDSTLNDYSREPRFRKLNEDFIQETQGWIVAIDTYNQMNIIKRIFSKPTTHPYTSQKFKEGFNQAINDYGKLSLKERILKIQFGSARKLPCGGYNICRRYFKG